MTIFFASVSGLWGVLVTDSIQFVITMTGTFAVAYFALQQPEVGGLSGLLAKIARKTLNLLPDFGDWPIALSVFIIPITIQWWSVWYPGRRAGRRQLHRAAHARAEEREGRASPARCSST